MVIYRVFLFFLLLSLGGAAFSQDRYMVFFKDKAGSNYTTNQPLSFLSQKAVDRRIKLGVGVSTADIPVSAEYVSDVKETGAEVYFSTRWLNGVLVQCEASLIPSIESLAFVDRVEFVAPQARLTNAGRRKITLKRKNASAGIETKTQLDMVGITQMHTDAFQGEGITIAVFDGGFQGVDTIKAFQHIFLEDRFNESASYDFVTNSGNVFQFDDHGTQVFSVIAGYIPDAFTGGAMKANFQLYVTEDDFSEHRIEEYNWLFAAERADSAGVDIITSSLGYYDFDIESHNYTKEQMDGETAVSTRAAQLAADRGILVVCSAGNEGTKPWKIITAPADAEDVLAIGNVTAQGILSPSSSRGPTAVGAIKPDLVALGTAVRTIRGNGTLAFSTGTSLSTPLVTSLAAGVWQTHPELTNFEVIEALRRTASNANTPNNDIGYGIPNYIAVVNYFEQNLQPNIFEVLPNPVVDTVTIRPFDPQQISSCSVEVVGADGRIVRKDTVQFSWLNPSHRANLSHLAPGVYILRVLTGRSKHTFRFVKD